MIALPGVLGLLMSWRGRVTRSEYIIFELAQLLLLFLLSFFWVFFISVVEGEFFSKYIAFYSSLLIIPAMFCLVLVNVSFMIRRLHDANFRGWWALLLMVIGAIPYAGLVVVLILMLLPGTKGTNRFGPNPREQKDQVEEVDSAA
jgi:uncharacterized membrane protein YhaH (DUF805 family)